MFTSKGIILMCGYEVKELLLTSQEMERKKKPSATQVVKEIKNRLRGDTTKEAARDEVMELKVCFS